MEQFTSLCMYFVLIFLYQKVISAKNTLRTISICHKKQLEQRTFPKKCAINTKSIFVDDME